MDHSGMMMGSGTCKVSMLWNWNTIDACFISEQWHITSTSMFAGSCVAVIFLVMSLELLRRLGKEYDRHIRAQYQRYIFSSTSTSTLTKSTSNPDPEESCCAPPVQIVLNSKMAGTPPFRPNVLQQAVRSLLHVMQFAVAYFIMLLFMYGNGYFIICILIGAFVGSFVFTWETMDGGAPGEDATLCCG